METIQAKNRISSYIIQSQEEEIKRIALELHEGVGQTLYSLFTGLQVIESGMEQEDMKNYIQEMNQMLAHTIQEIRLLSVELHPPTLTTLGLSPALKSYLNLYTSTYGIMVDLINEGEEHNLKDQENITLFRVCQEALGNIAKYADTSKVQMLLKWESDHLSIEITDYGNGFDVNLVEDKSAGLAAMKERMLLIGGKCTISSIMGEGTTIRVFLPL
ncbi:histidine kinase [Bacillus sp. 31A1R]|uniref:histidine kinase n=1 Tax=Robertmurraya mangrovi TaxID=3098077 RepID=A0ABU5IWU6_9BACI|nr:ATP-binding protein [Bacillus sp. 31A1R]MDZ5471607.1 histidine kinase [Bacillus sp. 31A1R]